MGLALSVDELLVYTNGERSKWEEWFGRQPPAAVRAPLQRDGNYPTVWRMMDHIFLVEKRHTQRLKGESPVDEATGVAEPDVQALFAYGRAVRGELEGFVHSASGEALAGTREFKFRSATVTITARKLVFHILFHEIRHWAQIATAVRNAGLPPPGNHDLVFSDALE
jgi:uncharacterized damage-inducible protein DinB